MLACLVRPDGATLHCVPSYVYDVETLRRSIKFRSTIRGNFDPFSNVLMRVKEYTFKEIDVLEETWSVE